MPSPKANKTAGWVAICVACVSGFEGLRQVAYRDPVGIPTICFGETQGVELGQKRTVEECKAMLAESLEKANAAVTRCVTVPMSEERRAALVSLTYNIGGTAFCGSTLVKQLNAGYTVDACNQLLRWNRAKGIVLPGLTNRREQERLLCLKGLV